MPMLSTFGGGSARGFKSDRKLEEFIDTYNYTGSSQSFTIPGGVNEVTAYVFGPGGGSDPSDGVSNSRGGAGGYSVGTINTSAGGTLRIIVGGAGGNGTQDNGSGGGYSGVFTSNWQGSNVNTDHAAAIIVAGGGGGAGDGGVSGGTAGAGGYPNGQQGAPTGSGGGGGTQSGGGTYTGNGGGSCTATCTGTTLRGGTGCGGAEGSAAVGWPNQIYGGTWGSAAGGNGCNAGAGGGGYYGGGGGGGEPNGGNGGGGSGYIGGSGSYTVTNGAGYSGNFQTPASQATSSPHYSTNISIGGRPNVNYGNGNHYGGHGKVVLVYYA